MRLIAGITLGLSLSASAAYADVWSEWVVAAQKTQTKPLAIVFVDRFSITRTPTEERTAKVLTVQRPATTWDVSISARLYDCNGGRVKVRAVNEYKGGELVREDKAESDWVKIVPKTLSAQVADGVCGKTDFLSDVVDDPVGDAMDYFDKLSK